MDKIRTIKSELLAVSKAKQKSSALTNFHFSDLSTLSSWQSEFFHREVFHLSIIIKCYFTKNLKFYYCYIKKKISVPGMGVTCCPASHGLQPKKHLVSATHSCPGSYTKAACSEFYVGCRLSRELSTLPS